jgi:hypothetical protein
MGSRFQRLPIVDYLVLLPVFVELGTVLAELPSTCARLAMCGGDFASRTATAVIVITFFIAFPVKCWYLRHSCHLLPFSPYT